MTTTYDPHHPQYLDEADVREESVRVHEICSGCRLCSDLCTSFPTLFALVDRFDDHDAGRLTPAEQDQVVEECFHCKLCAVRCPYTPGLHEWAVDFPRLMLRSEAMRRTNGHRAVRQRLADRTMARTDLFGRLGSLAAPVVNSAVRAPAGSFVRTAIARTTGVSPLRLLPPYAKQRFSTWMKRRSARLVGERRGTVTVFPTCLVEYQDVQVGRDLVRVYERNGIECATTASGCCGASWLQAGDVARFTKAANENVRVLAAEIRARGGDVVVPEPTCGYVLKRDYLDYCDPDRRADAELVAEHTVDASEYLMALHAGGALDTDFTGDVPERVTYHAACHLRAQDIGLRSRDLLELTGAEVVVVQQCSGIGGTWGLRDGNEPIAVPIAEQLADRIERAVGDRPGIVAGDCSSANTAIAEQTGRVPSHPMSVVARAYGIPPD